MRQFHMEFGVGLCVCVWGGGDKTRRQVLLLIVEADV